MSEQSAEATYYKKLVDLSTAVAQDKFAEAISKIRSHDLEEGMELFRVVSERVSDLVTVIMDAPDSAEADGDGDLSQAKRKFVVDHLNAGMVVKDGQGLNRDIAGAEARRLRKSVGLSQREVGEACDLRHTTISQIELNQGKIADETIQRVLGWLREQASAKTGG